VSTEQAEVIELGRVRAEELEEVETQTELVVARAHELTITSDADYEAAGAFLVNEVKAVLKAIRETFDPIVKAANTAHKEALAQRKAHEAPLLEAERVVKAAMGTYHAEQVEARRKEEEARLDAARREAEERALEEAERLEKEGRTEAAEARVSEPVVPTVAAPATKPAKPKAEGVSVRMLTKYRIVAEGDIKRKFLKPDEKKIGQIVRSMGKDAEAIVGGIEVYEEPSVASR
jgi:hypothetical protein